MKMIRFFERVLGPEPKTFFRVAFDDETVALLMEAAEAAEADPRTLIASIVKTVLVDDARAHDVELHDHVTLH